MTRPQRPPDIEAAITFLQTEDGGKTNPVRSGYTPHHMVIDGLLTSGHHEYIGKELVNPGETANVQIWLLAPEHYPHTIWVGREIRVQEASRLVAHVKITKVLNAVLEKGV